MLAPCLVISSIITSNTKIIIHKFQNKSEYKDKWNIESGFAELLREHLQKNGFINIGEIRSTLSNTNDGNAVIITGEIKKFKFREHIIAAYKVGGYRNYTVDIAVLLKINYVKDNIIEEKLIGSYISNKNYGITLFGGPGGSDDFEKNVYRELQKIRFAGKKYWKTIYGTATKDCIKKMVNWINKLKTK